MALLVIPKRGGSCNVNELTIIPHCNGTHTESVAHIVDEPVAVYKALKQSLFPVALVSIKPNLAKDVSEKYLPEFDADNLVITKTQLENSLADYSEQQLEGLVIRTLPNSTSKKTTTYNTDNYPVYLTNCALNYLLKRKINHLLVDFPSIDKMFDQGMLSNHRLFWNVELNSTQLKDGCLYQ